MLWAPVLLGLGVGLYFAIGFEPHWGWGAGCFAVAISGMTATLFKTRQAGITVLCLAAVALVSLGWTVAQMRTIMVDAPVLTRSLKATMVEGTINTLSELDSNRGTRVILHDLVIEDLTPAETPHAVRLTIRKDDDLRPGQRIRVLAGLNPPSPPVMPDGYDFQRHAYFQRLGAFGFAYNAPEILAQTQGGALERFRQEQSRNVEKTITQPEASIVSALLLGERAAIPEKTWEEIRSAGLAHVISISGLHISMIAMGVFFAVRFLMALYPPLALRYPIKKYAAMIALIAAIAYAIMVGLTVPTVRSVMMTGLVLTAIMLDRSPFSLRLVAFSAFLILLATPEAITGPSFQMSYAAVAALVFFYDESREFWANQNKKGGWFRRMMIVLIGCCITSIIATIATAPYSMFHFQQFPIYSVIGNVLATPVIGFIIMPAAIFVYLLMPFGLDFIPLWLMGHGVSAMLWISHVISTWNYASLALVAWPLSSLIAFTLSGLTIMVLRGRLRFAAIIPLIIGVFFVVSYRPPDILASSSSKLFMVTTPEKSVWLSNRRSDKFSAENWIRAAGINPANNKPWPKEGILESGTGNHAMRLSCDLYGCLGTINMQRIAFSFDPRTLTDDCQPGVTIIANYPVKDQTCRATAYKIIDRHDLKHQGTHAIWINPQGTIDVKTVAGQRGTRPWTRAGSRR